MIAFLTGVAELAAAIGLLGLVAFALLMAVTIWVICNYAGGMRTW